MKKEDEETYWCCLCEMEHRLKGSALGMFHYKYSVENLAKGDIE